MTVSINTVVTILERYAFYYIPQTVDSATIYEAVKVAGKHWVQLKTHESGDCLYLPRSTR